MSDTEPIEIRMIPPPSVVVAAVVCMSAVVGAGFLRAMTLIIWDRPIPIVLCWAAVLTVCGYVIRSCYLRRNWARWFFAITFALNAFGYFVFGTDEVSAYSNDPMTYLGFAINGLAAALLFSPSAARWYKA